MSNRSNPKAGDLAAAVRRTPEHEAAEKRLRSLDRERQAVRLKVAEMNASSWTVAMGMNDAKRDLINEGLALDSDFALQRATLLNLRRRHGQAVAAALEPHLQAAVARALELAAELGAAVERVNAFRNEAARYGASGTPVAIKGPLAMIELPLRALIKKGKRPS
jgi:hypothetical protein